MKISIIGGGIAGCSTAHYLALEGHDVTLFERDSLASHASGFALGGLIPSVGGHPEDPYESLSRYSIGLHKELATQLGGPSGAGELDFLRKPSMMLVRDREEEAMLRQVYSRYTADHSLAIRWMSLGELSHIEARISPDVLGGMYVSEAYEVDPYKLTLALWQSAEQRGARIVNREVLEIGTTDDRVTGVETSDGMIAANAVVVAAGPWSPRMLANLGISLPVMPLKGQIIRLH